MGPEAFGTRVERLVVNFKKNNTSLKVSKSVLLNRKVFSTKR